MVVGRVGLVVRGNQERGIRGRGDGPDRLPQVAPIGVSRMGVRESIAEVIMDVILLASWYSQ